MGKKIKVFKPGDYVFAKVKGYPAWPAKVSDLNGKKYSIFFYGTGETGNLPANDLFDYFEHKQQFLAKSLKRRDYNEGLAQIDIEVTEAGLTSNGDKLETTVDSVADVDTTANKTITMDIEAEQPAETPVVEEAPQPEVVTLEPVKVPKKRSNSEAASTAATPAKVRKVAEIPEKEIIKEKELPVETPAPATEEAVTTEAVAEPQTANEPEPEVVQLPPPIEEPQPTPEIIKSPTPTATRGRKPSAKNATPRTPRQSNKIKTEVLSPVFEPHIPVPEGVSRSGRKIKPKRHFEEDAADNSTPPTPGKKIKLQPTTPSAAGAGVPAEEDHTSPTLPSAEANLSPSAPINNVTNTLNETQVKKGRKKVPAKQPPKSLNFITESELENMTEPPEESSVDQSSKENVLAVLLPSDKVVALKLFKDWPESFATPAAQTQWMQASIKNSIRLKHELETGKIKPQTVSSRLEMDISLPKDELQNMKREQESELKKKKVKILKLECKVLEIKKTIISTLNFDNPETDLCIQMLEELLEIDVTKLMLLKHPEITDTVRRIRKYVGNLPKWNLTDEETAQFNKKAQIIQKKAEACYDKFKSQFGVMDDAMFIEVFNQQQLLFKLHTNHLNVQEVIELIEEPLAMNQPDAFSASIVTEELINENKVQSKSTQAKMPGKKGDTSKKLTV